MKSESSKILNERDGMENWKWAAWRPLWALIIAVQHVPTILRHALARQV